MQLSRALQNISIESRAIMPNDDTGAGAVDLAAATITTAQHNAALAAAREEGDLPASPLSTWSLRAPSAQRPSARASRAFSPPRSWP